MENKKPLLSICIPTYNREKYLDDCIKSILTQKQFIDDKNIEFIISDNASTDSTQKIVKKYLEIHPLIKYYRNEANFGPEGNFIECIKHAKGEYIWLFGDDELYNTKQSIITLLDLLKNKEFILLIQNTVNKDKTFKNYKKLVKFFTKYDKYFTLNHTLITCNIFKKSIFHFNDAYDCTYTKYVHMYGIFKGLVNGGKVRLINNYFITRKERAPFHVGISNLWLIQSRYLYHIGEKFNSFYTKYIISCSFFLKHFINGILILPKKIFYIYKRRK